MNFASLLETLPLMAKGMFGIFVVTVVIIGAMFLLNLLTGKGTKEDK